MLKCFFKILQKQVWLIINQEILKFHHKIQIRLSKLRKLIFNLIPPKLQIVISLK